MLGRVSRSLFLALVASFATTGGIYAAKGPDVTEVGVGTFLVALGFMALLFIAYLIKHALGLDRMPPPEDAGAPDHH